MINQSAANPSGPKPGRAARLTLGTILLGVLCLGVWIPSTFGALSDTPREETWMTDGAVNAIACTPDTIYLGGEFSYVGPYTGGGAPISASTGLVSGKFPKIDGRVHACAADGAGGWFIAGSFTGVGGVDRSSLAHILADGSMDPAWNAPLINIPYGGGTVNALAVSGSTVYVAGDFTNIGGQARSNIAALDASTGNVTSWKPNADHRVYAVALSGSTVYVGGDFENVGGQARRGLAALDASTGNATPWNPNATGSDNRSVYALAVSGSTVYAGGSFFNAGGQGRDFLAAFDASTGEVTAWDPHPYGGNPYPVLAYIYALAVSGSTVYAGGNFTTIGGRPRNHIAALDASTGAATTGTRTRTHRSTVWPSLARRSMPKVSSWASAGSRATISPRLTPLQAPPPPGIRIRTDRSRPWPSSIPRSTSAGSSQVSADRCVTI